MRIWRYIAYVHSSLFLDLACPSAQCNLPDLNFPFDKFSQGLNGLGYFAALSKEICIDITTTLCGSFRTPSSTAMSMILVYYREAFLSLIPTSGTLQPRFDE